MLRSLFAAALLAMPLTATANGGWEWDWDFAPNPWKIDAMDWALEVQPDLSEADIKALLPPPSDPDYCLAAGCSDADRMEEFAFKLFKDDPPANLPAYPLGCSGSDCIWTW